MSMEVLWNFNNDTPQEGVVKNRRVPVCFLKFRNENGAGNFVFFVEKAIFRRGIFGPNWPKTGGQFGSPKSVAAPEAG